MGDHIHKKKNCFFHHSMSGIMHHSLEPFSRQLSSLTGTVTLLLALCLIMAERRQDCGIASAHTGHLHGNAYK